MVLPALATVPAPRSDPQGRDPETVWQRVLSRLQFTTDEAQFSTYLRRTRGLAYDPGASVIRVAAANPFHVPWVEGKLSSTIHTAVAEELSAPVRVEFFPIPDATPDPDRPRIARRQRPTLPPPTTQLAVPADVLPSADNARSPGVVHLGAGSPLNARYTFDSFVVGQ